MRAVKRVSAAAAAILLALLCGCSTERAVASAALVPAHDADMSQNAQTEANAAASEPAAEDERPDAESEAENEDAALPPDEAACEEVDVTLETEPADALISLALNADFGDCGIAEADTPLLREFLSVFLTTDAPSVLPQTPSDFDTERVFYEIKNALTLLLREARQDAALEQALCERQTWHLTRENAFFYVLRAEGETALTAQIYLATQCVSAEDFETASLRRLRQKAATGENADALSEEMRERFVQYLMQNDAYGWLFTGFEESTTWQWSAEDGCTVLTLRCYPNGAEGAATEMAFEADAAGEISERPIG